MAIFRIPKKSKDEKLKKLSPAQRAELDRIEADAIANFKGDFDQLESALGMMRLGHHVGWKVLYIIHSKRTIRNYEEILSIKVRDLFAEDGPSSYRSMGYQLAQQVSNFWKIVSGAEKLPTEKKREIER